MSSPWQILSPSFLPISIHFEYTLRASNPFLIVLHPISLTWFSWAGTFCAVQASTLHPFLLFSIVDGYYFSNPDISLSIHSVDLKASYRVYIPIISVHVQARATCRSTVRTRAPNVFNPQIGLKCNCISLWDVIYKREITGLGYDWEETENTCSLDILILVFLMTYHQKRK